jgi:hypothetical protein
MKWEADWWGIKIINETMEELELLEKIAEKLPVQAREYYENGVIEIKRDFSESLKKSDGGKLPLIELVFHR